MVAGAALVAATAAALAAGAELDLGAYSPSLRSLPWLGGSVALFVLSQLAAARIWAVILRLFAPATRARHEAALWLLSQLGKYVPGKVAGFALRALRSEARPEAVGAAIVTEALAHAGAAGLLGAGALFATGGERTFLALIPFAALALLALARQPLARALDRLLVRCGRAPLELAVRPLAAFVPLAGALLLYWILAGGAFALFCRGFGFPADGLRSGAWFALAWCAGFLAIPVPAGLGVREAVLVSGLAPALGLPAATLLAVGYRAWSTLLDVATAAAGSAALLGAPALRSALARARPGAGA